MALAQPVLTHTPPPDTQEADHDERHAYPKYSRPRLPSSHSTTAPPLSSSPDSHSSAFAAVTASSEHINNNTVATSSIEAATYNARSIENVRSSYVFVNGILDVRPPSPPGQKSIQAPYPPALPPKNGYRAFALSGAPAGSKEHYVSNGIHMNVNGTGHENENSLLYPSSSTSSPVKSSNDNNRIQRFTSNASTRTTTTTTASAMSAVSELTPDNSRPLRSQSVDSYISLTPTASTSASVVSASVSPSLSNGNDIIDINGTNHIHSNPANTTFDAMSNTSLVSSSSIGTTTSTNTNTNTSASTSIGAFPSSINTNTPNSYITAVFSSPSASRSTLSPPPLPPLKQRRSASTHGAPSRRSPAGASASSSAAGRKPTRLNSYDFSHSLPEKSTLLSRDFALPSSSSPPLQPFQQQQLPHMATTDEDAAFQDSIAKQAEQIRKEREAKRRVRERREAGMDPTRETVLVGNLVGEDHVNYVLMYNMLTGIRVGVSCHFIFFISAYINANIFTYTGIKMSS